MQDRFPSSEQKNSSQEGMQKSFQSFYVPEQKNVSQDSHIWVDIALVLDTTGSMDSVLRSAKDEMLNIVNHAKSKHPNAMIRVAVIHYNDYDFLPQLKNNMANQLIEENSPVSAVFEFNSDIQQVTQFISTLKSTRDYGDDTPEALELALRKISRLNWRVPTSPHIQLTKLAFIVTDAPPHGLKKKEDVYPEPYQNPAQLFWEAEIKTLAEMGIKIHTLYAQHVYCRDNPDALYVCKTIAARTRGMFCELNSDNQQQFHDEIFNQVNAGVFETARLFAALMETLKESNATPISTTVPTACPLTIETEKSDDEMQEETPDVDSTDHDTLTAPSIRPSAFSLFANHNPSTFSDAPPALKPTMTIWNVNKNNP